MALKLAALLRNARLDVIETHIGTAALLKVFKGSAPADADAADTGTVLASITCPSDYFSAASSGAMAKTGTWSDASADSGSADTPTHFRMYTSGAVPKIQGTAGIGSGDLSFDGTITAGQTVTISTFTLTEGNA